jgi:FkbM family methyltransferase
MIQATVRSTGQFEAKINNWIFNNVKPGWLVYDLGANIGEISEMCALMGAKVHAFEAQKTVCDSWIKTRKYFNVNNDITIHNVGISDKEENLKLYVSKNNCGGSSFSEDFVFNVEPQSFNDGIFETLHLVPLSSLNLPDQIPDLIKLDIQDFEEKAWDGMTDNMRKAKNVIAEVLFNTQISLLLKYLNGRSAYSLDGNFITKNDPKKILEYVKNNGGYYENILFM